MNKKNVAALKWIITGQLEAITPFFIGIDKAEDLTTSANILLNRNDSFWLPRSSIRGALRRDLRIIFGDACNTPSGSPICYCHVCQVMRSIKIDAISS
jgi:CRISPR/Cas system CSM-associated protein Csm3 (group 7 of RAMP superfamily)